MALIYTTLAVTLSNVLETAWRSVCGQRFPAAAAPERVGTVSARMPSNASFLRHRRSRVLKPFPSEQAMAGSKDSEVHGETVAPEAIEFLYFDKHPQHNAIWDMAAAPRGLIHVGLCNEGLPGLCAQLYVYDVRRLQSGPARPKLEHTPYSLSWRLERRCVPVRNRLDRKGSRLVRFVS